MSGRDEHTPDLVHLRLLGTDEQLVRLVIDDLKASFAARLRVARVRVGRRGEWLAYGYVRTDRQASSTMPVLQVHTTPRGLLVQHGQQQIHVDDIDIDILSAAIQQRRRQRRSR